MRLFFIAISFLFSISSFSQLNPLEAELILNNSSEEIDDVTAVIKVKGGEAPYRFYWNQQKVSVYQRVAAGLPEEYLSSITRTTQLLFPEKLKRKVSQKFLM